MILLPQIATHSLKVNFVRRIIKAYTHTYYNDKHEIYIDDRYLIALCLKPYKLLRIKVVRFWLKIKRNLSGSSENSFFVVYNFKNVATHNVIDIIFNGIRSVGKVVCKPLTHEPLPALYYRTILVSEMKFYISRFNSQLVLWKPYCTLRFYFVIEPRLVVSEQIDSIMDQRNFASTSFIVYQNEHKTRVPDFFSYYTLQFEYFYLRTFFIRF